MTVRVEIVSDSSGVGSIKVDGVDLSHVVTGAQIELHAMGPSRVTLELVPCEVAIDAHTELQLLRIQRNPVEQLKKRPTE